MVITFGSDFAQSFFQKLPKNIIFYQKSKSGNFDYAQSHIKVTISKLLMFKYHLKFAALSFFV